MDDRTGGCTERLAAGVVARRNGDAGCCCCAKHRAIDDVRGGQHFVRRYKDARPLKFFVTNSVSNVDYRIVRVRSGIQCHRITLPILPTNSGRLVLRSHGIAQTTILTPIYLQRGMERTPAWRTWRLTAHTPICMDRAGGGYEADDEGRRHFGCRHRAWGRHRPGTACASRKKPAYVIAQVQVSDPTAFRAYAAKVPATLAAYHGRYIVRGKPEVKEGDAPQGVYVILAFDSLADAETVQHAALRGADPRAAEISQVKRPHCRGPATVVAFMTVSTAVGRP